MKDKHGGRVNDEERKPLALRPSFQPERQNEKVQTCRKARMVGTGTKGRSRSSWWSSCSSSSSRSERSGLPLGLCRQPAFRT